MSRSDKKIERLSAIGLFRSCDAAELKAVASIVEQLEVGPGEVLCRQGERASSCYLIDSGEAEVIVDDEVLAVVGPGETVGEMGLIERQPRMATVVASTDMVLFSIERQQFDLLLDDSPTLARAMLAELSNRLRRAEKELLEIWN